MASTKGLTFEIISFEGGPSITRPQAAKAVAKVMQRFKVPRVPHERFDQSIDTIISDAALSIGKPDAHWEYDGGGLYTIIFDYRSLSITGFNRNIEWYNTHYATHYGASIATVKAREGAF